MRCDQTLPLPARRQTIPHTMGQDRETTVGRPGAGPTAHSVFTTLLEELRQSVRHSALESDTLTPPRKHALQRAILAIGSMLADVRTLLAGETLARIPHGILAGMEFELIAMDFAAYTEPARALGEELTRIHGAAETLLADLLQAQIPPPDSA